MNLANSGKTAAGTAVAALLLLGLAAPAAAHRMEKRFPVEVRPVVTIRNFHGRINVKSWQKPRDSLNGCWNCPKPLSRTVSST